MSIDKVVVGHIPCKDGDAWSISAQKDEFEQMKEYLPGNAVKVGLHFFSKRALFEYAVSANIALDIKEVQMSEDSKGPWGCFVGHAIQEKVKELTPGDAHVWVFFPTTEETCEFHMHRDDPVPTI